MATTSSRLVLPLLLIALLLITITAVSFSYATKFEEHAHAARQAHDEHHNHNDDAHHRERRRHHGDNEVASDDNIIRRDELHHHHHDHHHVLLNDHHLDHNIEAPLHIHAIPELAIEIPDAADDVDREGEEHHARPLEEMIMKSDEQQQDQQKQQEREEQRLRGTPVTEEFEHKIKQLHFQQENSPSKCDSPFGTVTGVGDGVTAYSNCNDKTTSNENNIVMWNSKEKKIVKDYFDKLDEQQQQQQRRKKQQNNNEDTDQSNNELLLSDDDDIKNAIENNQIMKKVVSGMKWQCVEFSRRYLLEKMGLMFKDVAGAADMWRLTFLVSPDHAEKFEQKYELQRFPNFASKIIESETDGEKSANKYDHDERKPLPRRGDLLVWPIQKDMPFGHTGVVVGFSKFENEEENQNENEKETTIIAKIQIAEQNFDSKVWPGEHRQFGRELLVVKKKETGEIGIRDPTGYEMFGWMRPHPRRMWTGAMSHPH